MQKLSTAAIYGGLASVLVGGILKITQLDISGIGPRSFAGLAALCFLFAIAVSAQSVRQK